MSPVPPDAFVNRELSWLEFNRRVLEEAQDPTVPLLERVKFLAIFSSNLDEFFMVRVAELKRRIRAGDTTMGPDELSPTKTLTPLAIDPGHPFPHLANRSLCLIVSVKPVAPSVLPHATLTVVRIPGQVVPRFVALPGPPGQHAFMLLEDVIRLQLPTLYTGYEIVSCHAIRVTRDAEIALPRKTAADLLTSVEAGVRERRMGDAVRLQYDADLPAPLLAMLVDELELGPDDLYAGTGFTAFSDLFQLYAAVDLPRLKDHPLPPRERRRGRPARSRDQDDALPREPHLADRPGPDPGRRERQGGGSDGRAAGSLRRGGQHPLGAGPGGSRGPRRLRPARLQDPLQGLSRGAPGDGRDPTLLPPRDRELQRADRRHLRGLQPLHLPGVHRRGRHRAVQHAHRLHAAPPVPPPPDGPDRHARGLPAAHPPRGRARPPERAGAHRGQDEQPRGPHPHRRAVRGEPGRGPDRPDRARDLLPPAGHPRLLRPHPGDLDRGPLPRARPRLLLPQRRPLRVLAGLGGLDAAEPRPPGRDQIGRAHV